MASPNGRPWWDIPASTLPSEDVDYTYNKSQAEMEHERVAQFAIDAATSMIQKGDPKQWAEPTPEKRAFLAPAMIEKGFHDPVAAVPEVLHGPYKAFSEMYQLLATGSQPSDPEVVKRATEVAGLVTGGAVTRHAGGLRGGAGETLSIPTKPSGTPKYDIETASTIPLIDMPATQVDALHSAATKLDDFGRGPREEIEIPVESLVTFQETVGKKKLEDMQKVLVSKEDLDSIPHKPAVVQIGDKYAIVEGNHRANIAKASGHDSMTVSLVGDITEDAMAFLTGGSEVGIGGGKLWNKLSGKKPTKSESLETLGIDKDFVNAVKGMGLEVFLNTDNHIILKGKGAVDGDTVHQTMNFGKDTAALEDHLVKLENKIVQREWNADEFKANAAADLKDTSWKKPLSDDALEATAVKKGKPYWETESNVLAKFDTREEAVQAFKVMSEENGFKGDPKYSVFEVTDPQDKVTGKWAAYNVFEGQPPKSFIPDYGNIGWHATVSVNDKNMTWHEFVYANKDVPEITDMVKQAHASGVGYITWGGGTGPEITIKVPTSGKPPAGASARAIKPEHIPTEMEMSRWPNAKVIDRITIDEAHPGPIIGYHGTQHAFINFDISKSNDIGIHFGTKEQAGNRAYLSGAHPRIIPAHIDIKNPLDLPDLGGWYPVKMAEAIQDKLGVDAGKDIYNRIRDMMMKDMSDKGSQKAYQSIRNTLDKMGYDSIRYLNAVEGEGWSYIVWQKGKVKSATNPDHILYAGGPGPLPKDRYAEDEDGRPAD